MTRNPHRQAAPTIPLPTFSPERTAEIDAFVRENETARAFALYFDQLRREGTHPTVAANVASRLLYIDKGIRFDGEVDQVR